MPLVINLNRVTPYEAYDPLHRNYLVSGGTRRVWLFSWLCFRATSGKCTADSHESQVVIEEFSVLATRPNRDTWYACKPGFTGAMSWFAMIYVTPYSLHIAFRQARLNLTYGLVPDDG